MCAITDRAVRPEPAALVPVAPALKSARKPRTPKPPSRITDDMLLDLAPLLASKLPEEVCPLCGFPRTPMNCENIHRDIVQWCCDTCRNSVRRADQIRRRVADPTY